MKYSKALILLGICSIVSFLFVFGLDLQLGNTAKMETAYINMDAPDPQLKQKVKAYQKPKQVSNKESSSSKSNEKSDFYQVIIDNNLFRPLGWKPPNKEPEFSLVGTTIDTIGNNSEAFVVENRSNQFYIVGVGDEIGDAVIKEIEDRKVTLYKNGEMITLNSGSMGFLKSGGSPSRATSSPQYESKNDTESNNQSRTRSRSKSTDIEDVKKRYAQIMKESEKQMKSTMKEVAKIEKAMDKAEYKALIEKKKVTVTATDLKLKMQSNDK